MRARWFTISLALAGLFLMLFVIGCGKQQQPAQETGKPSEATGQQPAGGQGSELDFFNGKTVTFIVATKPGGGYDAYARLVQPYLQKYLPGSTVIVKNVPGAGHIIGANEVYAAKPDGLTIGTFNTALIYSQIVGAEGIKFDLTKFTWIAKMASDQRVLMVGSKTPYKTIEDVINSKKPVVLSSAGIASASNTDALILQDALGLNFKLVPGYSGEEAELAIVRGEVDGTVGTFSSLKPFVDNGDGRVLLQIGGKRHPALPDVPLATELVKPEKKALVDLITAMTELGRLVAAPPDVPPARAQALIDAFRKALSDPELLAKAKQADMPIDPAFGEDVAQLVRSALNQSPENMEKLKKILEPVVKEK